MWLSQKLDLQKAYIYWRQYGKLLFNTNFCVEFLSEEREIWLCSKDEDGMLHLHS